MAVDWQNLLKQVAPWIGAAATGNVPALVSMAAAQIGSAFNVNVKPTADAISAAIAGATPEQMLALKQADDDFAVKMQQLGFDHIAQLEQIAAGDRKDARAAQIANKSPIPAILTIGTGVGFLVTLWALFYYPIPQENRDLVVYMCGQLASAFGACLAFWVGTTRQSENKTHLIAQQAQ